MPQQHPCSASLFQNMLYMCLVGLLFLPWPAGIARALQDLIIDPEDRYMQACMQAAPRYLPNHQSESVMWRRHRIGTIVSAVDGCLCSEQRTAELTGYVAAQATWALQVACSSSSAATAATASVTLPC